MNGRSGWKKFVNLRAAAVLSSCLAFWACNSVLGTTDFQGARCDEGSRQCNGNTSEICKAGRWETRVACDHQTCVAGECQGTCAPEEKQCHGLTPQACANDGTWQPAATPCDSANGFHCAAGQCIRACIPGDRRCNGHIPQFCTPLSNWEDDSEPCDACFGCNPVTTKCNDQDSLHCVLKAGELCSNGSCICKEPQFGILGSPSYSTGTYPDAVIATDLNGDAKTDLVVANRAPSTISVLINNSSGFNAPVDYKTDSTPEAIAAGDLNGDGKMDLLVANLGNTGVSVLMQQEQGKFGTAVNYTTGDGTGTQTAPTAVVAAELNGDGKMDLAVTASGTNNLTIFVNKDDGTFERKGSHSTSPNPASMAAADLNGDGRTDLAIASGSFVNVLFNDGTGSFTKRDDYPMEASLAIAIVDLNGDGPLDLAVLRAVIAGSSPARAIVTTLLNDGAGKFFAPYSYDVGTDPRSFVVRDLTGDSTPDLAVLCTDALGKTVVRVLVNNGAGMFNGSWGFFVNAEGSLAAGDFNGDGRTDLAATSGKTTGLAVYVLHYDQCGVFPGIAPGP